MNAFKRGGAVLAAATGLFFSGGAWASTPWVYEETRLGGVAYTCLEDGSERCAAAFCGRSGVVSFALRGVEPDEGAEAVRGSYAVDGVSRAADWAAGAGPERRERVWTLPVEGAERSAFFARLRAGLRLDLTIDDGDPDRFTLRGSSRALRALSERCASMEARFDGRDGASGPELIGRYAEEAVGAWGTPSLCARGGWRFEEAALETPGDVRCLRVAVAETPEGELRVRGLLCTAVGLPTADVVVDLVYDYDDDRLSIDFVESEAPAVVVPRCPEPE